MFVTPKFTKNKNRYKGYSTKMKGYWKWYCASDIKIRKRLGQ